MKKKLLLGIISAVLCLSAAAGTYFVIESNSGEEEIIPIFQGVSLENEETYSLKRAKTSNSISYEDVEDEIKEDFGVLEITSYEYYAKSGDKVYITLNFYNPSQFEILSFVLNGVKYQSFQFTEDSSSSEIRVAVDIPKTSGILEYAVEEVKYIDGNKIKDCIMEGKSKLEVAVAYEDLPYTKDNLTVDFEKVDLSINIFDDAAIVEKSRGMFKIYLFDDKNHIIENKPLNKGKNNISFNNLKEDSLYKYMIVASYDSYDGKGMTINTISTGNFTTKQLSLIGNQTVTENSINLEVVGNNVDIKVTKSELFLNGNLIKSNNQEKIEFTNLLSNNEYEIKYYYEYNGKEYSKTVSYKTLLAISSKLPFFISFSFK